MSLPSDCSPFLIFSPFFPFSSLSASVTLTNISPDSHMRKGIGKVTNELTNPDSHLRTGQIRNGSTYRGGAEGWACPC